MDIRRLKDNLSEVEAQIQAVKREGQEVTLVAVTKTVDVATIEGLYRLGQRHIGENRPHVFLEKYEALKEYDDLVWHYIGSLQSRQVRRVINQLDYLHSLDRISLAQEIEKRADKPVKCFVQVNVSGEETKSGIEADQVLDWISQLASFNKVQVVGLMTMAPYGASREDLMSYFTRLKDLQEQVADCGWDHAPCQEVSMGMSGDFVEAVEAGASYIRVGTSLFEGVD